MTTDGPTEPLPTDVVVASSTNVSTTPTTAGPITNKTTPGPSTPTLGPTTSAATPDPTTTSTTPGTTTTSTTPGTTTTTSQSVPTTTTPVPIAATTPDSTESPAAGEGTLDLNFSLRRTFESSLSDSTSPAYRVLANEVTREVNRGFRSVFPRTYSRCLIRSFSNGSIRVNMTLVYHNQSVVPNGLTAEQVFMSVVTMGITNLNVDVSTINATTITSGGPTLKMTTTTAFCLPFFLTVIKGLLFSS